MTSYKLSDENPGYGAFRKICLGSTSRTINDRLSNAKKHLLLTTSFDEVNASALEIAHKEKSLEAELEGVKVTFLPYFIKATIYALQKDSRRGTPLFNTTIEIEDRGSGSFDYHYLRHNSYNIGYAVATEDRLRVPNVKEADKKSLLQISDEVYRKSSAIRKDPMLKSVKDIVAYSDLTNGTFTISNIGSIGGKHATAIPNFPETSILVAGKIEGKILPLSLTFDHRLVDGAYAVEFMNDIKEFL